jgi:hypothetical protein
MVELTGAYHRLATQTFDYFDTGLLVACLYLLLGLPFVRLARYSESRLGKGRETPIFNRPFTKTVGPEGKRWKRDRSDVRDRPKAPKTPTSNSSSFRRNKPSIAFRGAEGPGALQVIGDPLTTSLATRLGKSTEPTELQTMPFSSQLSSPLRTRCASFFPRKSTLFFML